MTERTSVIVGGGLAGATAATTLREHGYDGRIVIVGAEAHDPYIRPPLSKEYLNGGERADVFVHPSQWYADNAVELILETSVREIDPDAHEVVLEEGGRLGYERLLLATGARPRRLTVPGSDLDGVHMLRTLDDSDVLRAELSGGGRRVVIAGSGWIGLEVAASARLYGNEVTVVGHDAIPLSHALGDELGSVFERLHREHGVGFRLKSAVAELAGGAGRVELVTTDAGERLAADVVVVGIGATPNVGLAERAGLALGNGITTDSSMATSAVDVFAAGDVADPLLPAIGRHLRNEHWANAIAGGKVAAAAMLGANAEYDDIPYFYTDQYDLGMEYSGYAPLAQGADIVYRGDPATREFISFWVRDGRVVAGMNVNVWDVNDQVQRLIRSRVQVDRARLADEDVPLDAL
jgi:3-phenylpropionate/trans-cinnamate dioxygenase ferredoxin reductase subunit